MTRFLNFFAALPDIACLPHLIASSKFIVLEVGLRSVQGKSIVNSIGLKDVE